MQEKISLWFVTRSRGYKTFLMLISVEHEIYPAHHNIKMPTIVGILTCISRINTASESFKGRKILNLQHFSFYQQLKLYDLLSCA